MLAGIHWHWPELLFILEPKNDHVFFQFATNHETVIQYTVFSSKALPLDPNCPGRTSKGFILGVDCMVSRVGAME